MAEKQKEGLEALKKIKFIKVRMVPVYRRGKMKWRLAHKREKGFLKTIRMT